MILAGVGIFQWTRSRRPVQSDYDDDDFDFDDDDDDFDEDDFDFDDDDL
jgi:hypothetical protein